MQPAGEVARRDNPFFGVERMGVLNAAARKHLPAADFAGPDRTYPIPDKAHAQDALARGSANASSAEYAQIKAAVYKKYPELKPKSA